VYCLCVNVYCHRVSTQLHLTNISISKFRRRGITFTCINTPLAISSLSFFLLTPPMKMEHGECAEYENILFHAHLARATPVTCAGRFVIPIIIVTTVRPRLVLGYIPESRTVYRNNVGSSSFNV
jgi:hypothetical protein